MNERMNAARERYETIPVPAELNARVNLEVQRSRRKETARRRWIRTVGSLAGCAAAFVLMVQVSPTFAQALEPVPVLGSLVRVITGREYHAVDQTKVIHVTRPELVTGDMDSELARRVNREIDVRIDTLVKEAEARARETYDAWCETREEEDDFFLPVDVTVDYEVKCSTEKVLSFVLYMTEVRASSYTEAYAYNLDLTTSRELTLADLLGPNWKEIANRTVRIGIYQRSQIEGNTYFTKEEFGEAFESVSDDPLFYLNEAGNPVVVFQKYEIAPGYMGQQEFEIDLRED